MPAVEPGVVAVGAGVSVVEPGMVAVGAGVSVVEPEMVAVGARVSACSRGRVSAGVVSVGAGVSAVQPALGVTFGETWVVVVGHWAAGPQAIRNGPATACAWKKVYT